MIFIPMIFIAGILIPMIFIPMIFIPTINRKRFVTNGLHGPLFSAVLALAIVLSGVAALTPAFAQNASDVGITNHVFAERVIQTADGGYIAQDIVVGFERGSHTFETLTQIVLPRGSHNIELVLVDPQGGELERIRFGTLQASRDDWTQSLRGTWRNIRFRNSGVHALIVYRAGRVVARFSLVVT